MTDLSSIDELKRHLSQYGLFAKKQFGQNFLIDSQILDQIVEAAELGPEETVVEVGPGPGALSQRIVKHCGRLIAVEIDPLMIKPWKGLMKEEKNAEIINADVLKYQPPQEDYKVVANIPYYITSPILKHFLRSTTTQRPTRIVLMIQKEVADRICSSKKPTLLSWEIRVFGTPSIVCPVPPEAFFPSPKVDSAVLRIDIDAQPKLEPERIEPFFAMLSKFYSQPRKTLLNNGLAAGYEKEELLDVFEKAAVTPGLRPHQLQLEQWKQLLSVISSRDS